MAGYTTIRPITRPPARPPSIIRTALQNHPAWQTPPATRPQSPSTLTVTPPPAAPAQPPAAPANPGTHAVTTTVTPPPADLSGNRWMGYLNPDQLNGLNQAQYNYSTSRDDWTSKSGIQLNPDGSPQVDANGNPVLNPNGQAENAYHTTLADSQYAHDVSQSQAVDELAARGLSVSGIRDSDLTDINRTLAERQAQASSTLNTLVGEAARAITSLNNAWTGTQIGYQGMAAQNAAGLPEQQPYQVTQQVPNAPAPAAAPAAPRPGAPSHPPTRPPTRPQSITQTALRNHPAWRTPGPGGRR